MHKELQTKCVIIIVRIVAILGSIDQQPGNARQQTATDRPQ